MRRPLRHTQPAGENTPPTLANWRLAPWSADSFTRVREIVPTADIPAAAPAPLPIERHDIARLGVPDGAGGECRFGDFLAAGHTTGCVVLRAGRLAGEWYDRGYDGLAPHILFSITKSVTGLLAGILADRGLLDPDALVSAYLPEAAGSAYEGATVRHVLDMTVSTGFEESYLDPTGDYARYRIATNWNPAAEFAQASSLHEFLPSLRAGPEPHGSAFHYVSPNSDLLGWLCERAAGRRYADLVSELLWRPLGAEAAAYVTVDRLGAARAAGGLCARVRDLARLGEMVRLGGLGPHGPIVPGWWIDDLERAGDREAWARGDLVQLFPEGRYRAQWYQSGHASGALCCIGIHGQWLWIDPAAEVVIAKVSAQPEPADDALDLANIAALAAVSAALARA
ncbi:MAG: serine hydrolase [Pseudomonadota bacterium]